MELTPGGPAERAFRFQHDVAAIYRALGLEVEEEAALAGNSIDILAREKTASGTVVRTAIETKAYSRPLGSAELHRFAAVIDHLKRRGLVDRGVLVAAAGFSSRAREEASEYAIELVNYEELARRVGDERKAIEEIRYLLPEKRAETDQTLQRLKKMFVIMPFAESFDDVYILGIREVAERQGYVVERADDIEHNQDILAVLQNQIRTADVVIADTTQQNPNVFYEIGYAHAANKPTILVSRKGEKIPVDLQSLNHIFYSTIVDLREKLTKRLKAMFG